MDIYPYCDRDKNEHDQCLVYGCKVLPSLKVRFLGILWEMGIALCAGFFGSSVYFLVYHDV